MGSCWSCEYFPLHVPMASQVAKPYIYSWLGLFTEWCRPFILEDYLFFSLQHFKFPAVNDAFFPMWWLSTFLLPIEPRIIQTRGMTTCNRVQQGAWSQAALEVWTDLCRMAIMCKSVISWRHGCSGMFTERSLDWFLWRKTYLHKRTSQDLHYSAGAAGFGYFQLIKLHLKSSLLSFLTPFQNFGSLICTYMWKFSF